MTALIIIIIVLAMIGLFIWRSAKQKSGQAHAHQLADAQAEARRWIDRLGGQVYQLDNVSDPAAKQALADAGERYTAAGAQMEQASTARQCELATQTAMEGLYYVRAARSALGMDPGPDLPEINGQRSAGSVTEDRKVNVEGAEYEASPRPGQSTPHYYPGGTVAGRPVPQGWYSTPWWKPALIGGAWGVGSMLLFDAMFSGMHGMGGGWDSGFGSGYDSGFDSGYDAGMAQAEGGNDDGDFGGNDFGDFGGGDFGGSDFGDFGGGDFGGFD